MEPQTNKGVIVGIIVIIVLAIAAGIYYSWPKTQAQQTETLVPTPQQQIIDSAEKSLLVHHRYQNGEHIYNGVVEVPTPCHQVKAEAFVEHTFPEHASIALTTVQPRTGSGCAQVVTEKTFSVRYRASETTAGENISITLDGKPVLFLTGEKD